MFSPQAAGHVEQLTRLLLEEMGNLKELIGSRSSVPKEQARGDDGHCTNSSSDRPCTNSCSDRPCIRQVYPKFDALAKLWHSFQDELELLHARQARIQ